MVGADDGTGVGVWVGDWAPTGGGYPGIIGCGPMLMVFILLLGEGLIAIVFMFIVFIFMFIVFMFMVFIFKVMVFILLPPIA